MFGSNLHAERDTFVDVYTYPNPHINCDTNSITDPNAFTDCFAYGFANSNPDSNVYPDFNSESDFD